jgi:hypothetical protein
MRLKTLLITLLGVLVLAGGGCADSSTTYFDSGPLESLTDDDPFLRFEARQVSKASDFINMSKLPLTLEEFYRTDFEKELGAPVNTYKDDDDQVREYKITGGRIKATQTGSDKYGIVEYVPDNLAVVDFFIDAIVENLDTSKSYYVVVIENPNGDVLMVVEAEGFKVTSVTL